MGGTETFWGFWEVLELTAPWGFLSETPSFLCFFLPSQDGLWPELAGLLLKGGLRQSSSVPLMFPSERSVPRPAWKRIS